MALLADTPDAARYMSAAIALSQRGRGNTGPNPNVGCIIVNNDKIIGRGWTQPNGRPHAEAMALEQAGKAVKGADIYCTLEPCAHESDRGPACVNLLVESKPARVFIGTNDPDPRTNGAGIRKLQEAGIAVESGILEQHARAAMAGFLSRVEKQRPHITLKLGLSLDGCIALADGTSQWITGPRARAHAHLERARSDAILVGAGTYRTDAPSLDVRLEGLENRSPQKLILGSQSPLDNWGQISSPEQISELSGVNWLLIEGGGGAASAFLKADLIDRLLLYRAPIIIGGGHPSVADLGLEKLADAHDRWCLMDRRALGKDSLEIYARRT